MTVTVIEILSAISNAATAIGVGIAASQLFMARQQATTSFEDALTGQYRLIIERLPVEALFGEQIPPDTHVGLLPYFYRYFDLCNEQIFLRRQKRITDKTWENWIDGIKSNMQRPAFAAAWAEIARRAEDDFDLLRELCPPMSLTSTPGGAHPL